MKKIISIIAALAITMSAFVSFASVASAATAPKYLISATKITDWTKAPYASKKSDFDWSQKGSNFESYDVKVSITGLELNSEYSDDANDYNGGTIGNAINSFTANVNFETEGTRNTDWKYALLSETLSGVRKTAQATFFGYSTASAGALYPEENTTMTVASTDEIELYHLIFTVDNTKPITITLDSSNDTVEIGTFDDSYDEENDAYFVFETSAASSIEYKAKSGQVDVTSSITLGSEKEYHPTADVKTIDTPGYYTSYAFAKVTNYAFDTANYDYKVVATDDEDVTNEWDLFTGFASNPEGLIESKLLSKNVDIPFYLVVRSITHNITDVVIEKVAKQ